METKVYKSEFKTSPMSVELINHMGDDLTVVNAARVSFAKESTYDYIEKEIIDPRLRSSEDLIPTLKQKDVELIKYLANNGHWTPFSHCFVTFRVKIPIFVARQLIRSTVGLTINEESRRYIDSPPEFYMPETWRKRVPNLKQGSSLTETVDSEKLIISGRRDRDDYDVQEVLELSLTMYNKMLEEGVAPEQARIILPLNTMTSWYYSGSLYAFARVCNLRIDAHAQFEIQLLAKMISDHMKKLFPISWKALVPLAY